jgi:anti-sigma factor RsiW
MSCSPYDLRDYLFDELTPAQNGEVRTHLKACTPCNTELDSLRSTQAALLTLRDEEMPQRIGFVSDKVFEPSPFRRWLAGFWTSGARIGFVSSAMLSAALIVHTFLPLPAQIVHNSAQSPMTQAQLENKINELVAAQLQPKIDAAVAQAVAETDQRAQKRTTELLAAAEKRFQHNLRANHAQVEETRMLAGIRHNVAMVHANYEGTLQ